MNVERHLISAVLRERDLGRTREVELSGEQFTSHRDEWEWLQQYMQDYKKVPSKSAFVAEFEDFVVLKCDDIEYFAGQVAKAFVKRQMTAAMRQAATMLTSGDLDAAVMHMHRSLADTANSLGVTHDTDVLQDNSDVLREVNAAAMRIEKYGAAGVPTGFESWDEATGGLKPGELVIVGARLGAGKSWSLMQMAKSALLKNRVVLYDSLEMTRTQVALRMQTLLSSTYGKGVVQASSYMTARQTPDLAKYKRLLKDLQEIKGRLHVVDSRKGQMTPMTIAAQIERHKPAVVFIDYLTLLKMSGDGDWRSVGELTHQLQSMAQQAGIPIVAAAQLNRADGVSRKGVPGVEAIGQSDMIAQDAAQVVNFKRVSERVGQMKLAKNRHGRDGFTWWVEFRPGEGVIKEVTQDRGMDMADEDMSKSERG